MGFRSLWTSISCGTLAKLLQQALRPLQMRLSPGLSQLCNESLKGKGSCIKGREQAALSPPQTQRESLSANGCRLLCTSWPKL